jgi:hypothetical protein
MHQHVHNHLYSVQVGKTPADYQKQPAELPITEILKRVEEILGTPIKTASPEPNDEDAKAKDENDGKPKRMAKGLND